MKRVAPIRKKMVGTLICAQMLVRLADVCSNWLGVGLSVDVGIAVGVGVWGGAEVAMSVAAGVCVGFGA